MDGACWKLLSQGLQEQVAPDATDFLGFSALESDVHISAGTKVKLIYMDQIDENHPSGVRNSAATNRHRSPFPLLKREVHFFHNLTSGQGKDTQPAKVQ